MMDVGEYGSRDKWVPVTTALRVLKVVDGGTVSNMEGSYEYIGKAAEDSRQGVVLQLESWARC